MVITLKGMTAGIKRVAEMRKTQHIRAQTRITIHYSYDTTTQALTIQKVYVHFKNKREYFNRKCGHIGIVKNRSETIETQQWWGKSKKTKGIKHAHYLDEKDIEELLPTLAVVHPDNLKKFEEDTRRKKLEKEISSLPRIPQWPTSPALTKEEMRAIRTGTTISLRNETSEEDVVSSQINQIYELKEKEEE